MELIRQNIDLDVHAAPSGAWKHVVVLGMWHDKTRTRREWPEAAVVGPLRTLRGLDEFVRNLLLNPQITTVVLDGPEYTPGGPVFTRIFALWAGQARLEDPELDAHFANVRASVSLIQWDNSPRDLSSIAYKLAPRTIEGGVRPETIRLPIPPFTGSEVAPHGDPGDRVAGDTVDEVWPRILQRILAAGRLQETQYGPTRELLALVSVIRKPELVDRAVLGDAASREYYTRLRTAEMAEGAAYSYGSRLTGAGTTSAQTALRGHAVHLRETGGNLGLALGLDVVANDLGRVNQIHKVQDMLSITPGTRAAYLTPWRPEEDAGQESGRPCLVGMWFRVTARERIITLTDVMAANPDDSEVESQVHVDSINAHGRLHLVVAFRSHDMYGGYQMNLNALCTFLVEEALERGMEVGSLTCCSYSAHIYERDWTASAGVVMESKRRGLAWDQRSTWLVEPISIPCPKCAGVGKIPRFEHDECLDCMLRENEHHASAWDDDHAAALHCDCGEDMQPNDDGEWICPAANEPTSHGTCWDCNGSGQQVTGLRALALTPDGASPIRAFEAPTSGALRAAIEASGLIQEVGNALWLGEEIHRVGVKCGVESVSISRG